MARLEAARRGCNTSRPRPRRNTGIIADTGSCNLTLAHCLSAKRLTVWCTCVLRVLRCCNREDSAGAKGSERLVFHAVEVKAQALAQISRSSSKNTTARSVRAVCNPCLASSFFCPTVNNVSSSQFMMRCEYQNMGNRNVTVANSV